VRGKPRVKREIQQLQWGAAQARCRHALGQTAAEAEQERNSAPWKAAVDLKRHTQAGIGWLATQRHLGGADVVSHEVAELLRPQVTGQEFLGWLDALPAAQTVTLLRRTDHEEERMERAHERWKAEKAAKDAAELAAMEKETAEMEKQVETLLDLGVAKMGAAEIERRELLREGKPVPEDVLAIITNKSATLAKIKVLREDWHRRRIKWRWFERDPQGHSSPFKANQAFDSNSPPA
jgi:hypothetical protein